MTAYPRVDPISQFGDPTTTQDGLNCTPTAFCMLGELAAGLRLWPGTFRSFQEDRTGGISIPDGARAWPFAFPGTSLHWAAPNDGTPVPAGRVGDGLTADQLWDVLDSGDGVVVQGLYKILEDAGIGLQPGFTEGHAIYAEGTRSVPKIGRQVYILDPLGRPATGYKGRWIAFELLLRYARALSGSALIFAAWAAPRLPDTDTEEPNVPGLAIANIVAAHGTVVVKDIPGVQAVQVADLERFGIPPGSMKTTFAKGRLLGDPLGPDTPGNDRHTVRLVGDELAVLLDGQVTFTPAAAPGGDVQHTVTVLKDGVKVWEAKV